MWRTRSEDEEDEEDVGCRMCGYKLFVHKYILSYYNYLRYLLEIQRYCITYVLYVHFASNGLIVLNLSPMSPESSMKLTT